MLGFIVADNGLLPYSRGFSQKLYELSQNKHSLHTRSFFSHRLKCWYKHSEAVTQNKCEGSQFVPQASGQVGLLHLNRPVGVHGSPLLVVLELGEVGGQLATGLMEENQNPSGYPNKKFVVSIRRSPHRPAEPGSSNGPHPGQ